MIGSPILRSVGKESTPSMPFLLANRLATQSSAIICGWRCRMERECLAVLYEHPDWFKPLFAELERRGMSFIPLYARELSYDPALRSFPCPVVLNRLSPSSYLRGHAQAIFFCREFLRHLSDVGVRVINGYDAYVIETSKCAQIEVFERLGLRYPRSRVVNHASQVLEAASGLVFPIIVKPNIGGS